MPPQRSAASLSDCGCAKTHSVPRANAEAAVSLSSKSSLVESVNFTEGLHYDAAPGAVETFNTLRPISRLVNSLPGFYSSFTDFAVHSFPASGHQSDVYIASR